MERIALSRYDPSSISSRAVLDVVCAHSALLSALITGFVWSLWHWPFIIAEHFEMIPEGSGYVATYTNHGSLMYALPAFTLTMMGSRIIMCWIQGTHCYVIWTSVVYHSIHNLLILSVFAQLVEPIGPNSLIEYFSGEASISLVVAVWFSALILSRLCCSPKITQRLFRQSNQGRK